MREGIYPARDWLLLDMKESKYEGTLIIPETAKDAPSIGVVIAVGPGLPEDIRNIPLDSPHPYMVSKVGDKVLFSKYSGAEIEWEGKKLLLVHESDIIAYIKEETDG